MKHMINLLPLFSLLTQVPGLLAKSSFKPAGGKKASGPPKISKSVRQKMAEYYHDVLWQVFEF